MQEFHLLCKEIDAGKTFKAASSLDKSLNEEAVGSDKKLLQPKLQFFQQSKSLSQNMLDSYIVVLCLLKYLPAFL